MSNIQLKGRQAIITYLQKKYGQESVKAFNMSGFIVYEHENVLHFVLLYVNDIIDSDDKDMSMHSHEFTQDDRTDFKTAIKLYIQEADDDIEESICCDLIDMYVMDNHKALIEHRINVSGSMKGDSL